MKKFREYQYEIKETDGGRYFGIIYTTDGKDVLIKTEKFHVAQGAYIEVTKIVNKILNESN